ncbi:hypothetical protein ACFV16_22105 [Streptomyces massasporeus]|uniref:hypothetical protein n=1 Tax=Streptomyces massasporeus TaxID=67324 RepID=UPI00369F3544
MRAVIDDAVAAAVAPLNKRVDELSARLAAVENSGGPSPAPEPERPSTGRTARGKRSSNEQAGEGTKAGQ